MPITWSKVKRELLERGISRVTKFCELNCLPIPPINVVPKDQWNFHTCAYYRPNTPSNKRYCINTGINICIELCAKVASPDDRRNWNWPCSITDREPYGVLCHELAHHVDWTTSDVKAVYSGNYSKEVFDRSGELAVTSYEPDNPVEWFAEIFRIFITNPDLLKQIRPWTYEILGEKWKPIPSKGWKHRLGENVPDRILTTLLNKTKGK